MNMMLKTLFAAATALLLSTSATHAATILAGDTVSVQYINDGTPINTVTGTVGAGNDLTMFGVLRFDLNTGPAGDGFSISVPRNYCGFTCDGSDITLLFTGLDFGEAFTIDSFVNNTRYAVTATVIDDTSFSLTWNENPRTGRNLPAGTLFSGTFTSLPTPVPLPASGVLLLMALGGLAVARRRAG